MYAVPASQHPPWGCGMCIRLIWECFGNRRNWRDGFCEWSPALLHVRSESAPAAPKGTHCWVVLRHEKHWVWREKMLHFPSRLLPFSFEGRQIESAYAGVTRLIRVKPPQHHSTHSQQQCWHRADSSDDPKTAASAERILATGWGIPYTEIRKADFSCHKLDKPLKIWRWNVLSK